MSKKDLIAFLLALVVVALALAWLYTGPKGHAVAKIRAQATATAPAPKLAAPAKVSPAKATTAAPPSPAIPRTAAEAKAAAAKLTPRERAELAPLLHALVTAMARAKGGARPAPNEPEIFGTDRAGIRSAIRASVPDLKNCYAPWLGLNPQLHGRIVTSFTIEAAKGGGPIAKVTRVEVLKGKLGNRFLEGCVLSVLSDLRFHPPKDGYLTVHYPMIFTAQTEAGKKGAPAPTDRGAGAPSPHRSRR